MKYFIKNKNWCVVDYYNIDKLLYLLIDRSISIAETGSCYWYNNEKQVHRDYDFPACFLQQTKILIWFENGKRIKSIYDNRVLHFKFRININNSKKGTNI